MSTTNPVDQIEYPESDGLPMGETDLHRHWMMHVQNLLSYRYRDQRVYVACNLLVYYAQGQPTRYIVPDNFVVLDCDPGNRRVFKTWKEGRVPDVVFEITSRGTSSEDIVTKPGIYEQMGVREYFLYDPEGIYLHPPLQGYRLNPRGVLVEIDEVNHELPCETLGFNLRLNAGQLELVDRTTSELLLTAAEANLHLAERNERIAEEQERIAEEQRRFAEELRLGKLDAEARVRELETELERLRRERS